MIFTGQRKEFFPYDPDLQDWLRARTNPRKCPTTPAFIPSPAPPPAGIYCWTRRQTLLLRLQKPLPIEHLHLTGEKLAGSIVDNSTLVHDSRRNRLLFFRKEYGDRIRYNGLIQVVDLKTLEVSTLTPENAPAASVVSYLCQIRYDPKSDFLVAGCTFSANGRAARPRTTPPRTAGSH